MSAFVRNIFAALAGGNQPAALIDQDFSDVHDAIQNGSLTLVGSIAGTNTITGTTAVGPPTALTAGQYVFFIPGGSNTGPTTFNRDGLGAKNIFQAGAGLVGGEIVSSVPVLMVYDGTQYNIVGITASATLTGLTKVVTPQLVLNGVPFSNISVINFFVDQFYPPF